MTLERKILQIVSVAFLVLCFLGYLGFVQAKFLIGKQLEENVTMNDAETQLLRAQVHFKKQVQEWKNILLRGSNQNDYDRYYQLFELEEKKTQIAITRFIEKVNANSQSADLARQFLEVHESLAKQYRQALKTFNASGNQDIYGTDTLVKGIDRKPTGLIDELIVTLDKESKRRVTEILKQRRQIEFAYFTSICILLILLAIFLYRILRKWISLPVKSATGFANRIANGDLSRPLLAEASSADVNQLIVALNKMQSSLRANYNKVLKANYALESARDEALAATQAKTDFLANMSHEIRTPLNGVIGLAGLLQKSSLSQEQQSYVEMLQISGESLQVLVNDILDISKIEKGILSVKSEEFSLIHIIENAIRIVSERAEQSGLDYACIFESSIPHTIIGDPLRVEQILVNLLNNSIKFTENGGFYLSTRAKRRGDNKIQLLFKVVDTGIGIDEDKLTEIFDRFNQADTSTSRTHGGAGLGLFISKQLVKMMKGEISASSNPGEGSQFTVKLLLDASANTNFYWPSVPELENRRVVFMSGKDYQNRAANSLFTANAESVNIYSTIDEIEYAANNAMRLTPPNYVFIDSSVMQGLPKEKIATLLEKITKRESYIVWIDAAGDDLNIAQLNFGIKPHTRIHRPLLPSTLCRALNTLENENSREQAFKQEKPHTLSNKATFLVAEDNKVNQIIIANILETEGYEYTLAENGKEATEAAINQKFDCILMDCQMPIMDGYEATRMIRQRESHENYIVALTAHAMEGDKEKCLEAGMDDYLTKPITPTTFPCQLKKLLEDRSRKSRSLVQTH